MVVGAIGRKLDQLSNEGKSLSSLGALHEPASAPFSDEALERRRAIRVDFQSAVNLPAGVVTAVESQQRVVPANESDRVIGIGFEYLIKDIEHAVKDARFLTGEAPEIPEARQKRFPSGSGLEFPGGPLVITAAGLNHTRENMANGEFSPVGQGLFIHIDGFMPAQRRVQDIAKVKPDLGQLRAL